MVHGPTFRKFQKGEGANSQRPSESHLLRPQMAADPKCGWFQPPKIGGKQTPKMDGEKNGTPYF